MKLGSPKSIRALLLNLAKNENLSFQQVVTRYLHERLLYRISISEYKNRFILKGSNLLYAIEGLHFRPTMDIDMLAKNLSNDKEILLDIFKTICETDYNNDCVKFNPDTIAVSDIAQEKKYSGVRLQFEANFDSIRQSVQIDIGFGDAITPAPVVISYPLLLPELESPEILAYSIETVIAEKLNAMIVLGNTNSRMKDFSDLYILLKNNDLDKKTVAEAIQATFERRNHPFVKEPEIFTELFYQDARRRTMWNSFLRKNKLEQIDFETVVKYITSTLHPIYNTLTDNKI